MRHDHPARVTSDAPRRSRAGTRTPFSNMAPPNFGDDRDGGDDHDKGDRGDSDEGNGHDEGDSDDSDDSASVSASTCATT